MTQITSYPHPWGQGAGSPLQSSLFSLQQERGPFVLVSQEFALITCAELRWAASQAVRLSDQFGWAGQGRISHQFVSVLQRGSTA